ncbi:MAG: MSCRAMM family protein [Bacillota bacterium]
MLEEFKLGDKYGILLAALPPDHKQSTGRNISGIQRQKADMDTGGSLVGEVKDKFTGQPQQSIIAHLHDQEGKLLLKTSTNQQGVFVFKGLMQGTYQVQVQAPGYHSQTRSGTVSSIEAQVFFDIEPSAPGAFKGTVRHQNYIEGLSEVTVEVSNGDLTYTAKTDENGYFFLGPIFSGSYMIRVRKGQFQRTANNCYRLPPGGIVSLKINLSGADEITRNE